MAKVKCFEDLVAWQKAREMTRVVYQVTRSGAFAKDFGLAGQMQRAAVSMMANIAEGAERTSSAEYYQFVSTARASCTELRSDLYVALDVGYVDTNAFDRLLKQAEEVARVIGGLRASIARRKTQQRMKP